MQTLPYSPCLVAQARQIVTRFDTILAQEGEAEAEGLRGDAWDILLADHAARLAQRRRPLLRDGAPGAGNAA